MYKPGIFILTFLSMAAGLLAAPGPTAAETLIQHTYCTAQHCPQCPQPLDLSIASPQCRQCLGDKLRLIHNCSQNQPTPILDRAFIGVWRSTAGLRMRVVQTSNGFIGTLVWAPPKLRKRYPKDGVLIMDARTDFPGRYTGRLLAPNGQWTEAVYILGQEKRMKSVHPGDQKVRWSKTIELKLPDHRPVPGGPPPPGAPPDRPMGAQ